MLNIYENIHDEEGNHITGRLKLIVLNIDIDKEGNFGQYELTNFGVINGTGHQFIVDDYIESQVHKLKVVGGELVVKDGETLTPPVKTEKELKIEEMERQLAALKTDTEESTDELSE